MPNKRRRKKYLVIIKQKRKAKPCAVDGGKKQRMHWAVGLQCLNEGRNIVTRVAWKISGEEPRLKEEQEGA
jgi:hypothetical protein